MDNISTAAFTATLVITLCIPCILARLNRPAKRSKHYEQPRTDIKPYTPPQKAAAKPVKPPKEKRNTSPSPETIAALHAQADAEMHIAEALECRVGKERDPVKRARLEKQAALAWVRFNSALDRIDKLTPQ